VRKSGRRHGTAMNSTKRRNWNHERVNMEIPRNHKVRLSVSMQILENTIYEMEEILRSSNHTKTLTEISNNLPPSESALILKHIEELKESINYVAQNLDLTKRKNEVKRQILGAMTIERVNLEEIKSKRLCGYGEIPDDLREFLDPQVDKMMTHIDEICQIAGSIPAKGKA
jgi:hypothetical protein